MFKNSSAGVYGLALALVVCVGPSCKKSTPSQTELLVTVSSLTAVDRLDFVVRSYELDSDQLSIDLGGRDLTTSPYELVVQPSAKLSGHLFIAVKGYRAGAVVAGLARYIDFTAGTRATVAVTLVGGFIDADGDGFPAWGSVPGCTAETCDCDDTRADVSPFRPEVCSDPADNNCVGGGNWDSCPCSINDPPVPCTNLSPAQYPLSGVGACTLGNLRCVPDATGTPKMQTECSSGAPTDEVPSNYVDDDCDGVVDEGSPCTPGTMRRCHLGFVDDPGNPNADERNGASKRLLGECAKQPADWPANTPFPVQRCLGGVWSSVCEGDVLPQRAPPLVAGQVGFYFAELPNQCDGLDNDCNGLYDENASFDSDGDGYTVCGTTFAASPTNPRVNTHTLPGTSPDFVDCDDTNPNVHPGQTEICGNTIDEDCRCDHDDPSTQVDDIGRPLCKKAYGALDCSILPRSDQHPVGNCRDAPTYYRGFLSDSTGRQSCYVCNATFGKACNTTTGACTSKDDDCAGCPLGGALADADVAEARPTCRKARVGTCTGTTAPVWDDLVGEDPFHDCGVVLCAGWHLGVVGHRCYDRADVPASTCKAGAQCEGPGDLCVAQTQAAPTPLPLALCTMATDAGCSGNLTYAPSPQPAGQDYFDECSTSYVCSSTVGSEGPFYAGLADLTTDGVANPLCYFHADVANNQCNGFAACQSRSQACLAAPPGGAVPGRPVCMGYTTGSCVGAQGPGFTAIAYGQDPYGDCGVFRCNGKSGCQLPIGSTCTVSNDCEQGSSCVDGRCCSTATCGACQSCGLAASLGTCATVADGVPKKCGTGYCCGGSCTTTAATFGASCGGTGTSADCQGTWGCSVTAPWCVTGTDAAHPLACGYCVAGQDRSFNGSCTGSTGMGCVATAADCAACFKCSDGGTAATCAGTYVNTADSTPPGTCSGITDCGVTSGSCTCTATQQCKGTQASGCNGPNECAPGLNCVDHVCCNSGGLSACPSCQRCDVSGHVGACFSSGDGAADGCAAGQFCCGGSCAADGGRAFNAACAGTGNDADCAGTWRCKATAAWCVTGAGPTFAGPCGYCVTNDDRSHNGTCSGGSGMACIATTSNCAQCFTCADKGTSADCTGVYSGTPDSQVPNTCSLPGDCSTGTTGSCTCTTTQQCKGAAGAKCGVATECAAGLSCVDGVCCGSSSCPSCQRCNVSGHEGTCFSTGDGATDGCAAGQFCCGGTCAADGGHAFNAACAGTGNDADCSGTWQCNGTAAWCVTGAGPTFAGPCGYCVTNDDRSHNGTCSGGSGMACIATTSNCAQCFTCADKGTSADCTGVYSGTPDSQVPNTCSLPGDCSTGTTGSCTCTTTQQCKGAAGAKCGVATECAAGLSCVDGVCCGSSSCPSCQRCNVSGHEGTCFSTGDGATDGCAAGQFCCGGTCAADGGHAFNAACAGTGNDADCSGTWQCNGTAAWCVTGAGPTFAGPCGYCVTNDDRSHNGTCSGGSGMACIATTSNCAQCFTCADKGTSADCSGVYSGVPDVTSPNTCSAQADCAGSSTTCSCSTSGSCLRASGSTCGPPDNNAVCASNVCLSGTHTCQ